MAMDRIASVSRAAIRGERGAVSTIVAALLGGGVILGFTALSVDVGSLMFERRQLQAGADAAAMSLAKTCASASAATISTECSAGNAAAMNILQELNNLNNYRDDTGGFQSQPLDGSGKGYPQGVCGSGAAAAGLPPCPSPGGGLSECPPIPDYITANGVPYVEAHTQSKEANGTSLLPTSFIKTLVGGSTGNTVAACSRAAYGAPGTGIGALPITVSGCDWMHATNGNAGGGGGQYWASPKYLAGGNANGYGGVGQPTWPAAPATPPAQNPGGEVILLIQNPPGGQTAPTPCPGPGPSSTGWQGHALPGGFGILETVSGDPCKIQEYPLHWMRTSPGNSTGCNLEAYVGKVVFLPVFNCTADGLPSTEPPVGTAPNVCSEGNGSHAHFHRQGYAAFYLSGYHVTTTGSIDNSVKSVNPNFNQFPCNGGESCISGWFVTGELTQSTTISGPPTGSNYFGSYTVLPAG